MDGDAVVFGLFKCVDEVDAMGGWGDGVRVGILDDVGYCFGEGGSGGGEKMEGY